MIRTEIRRVVPVFGAWAATIPIFLFWPQFMRATHLLGVTLFYRTELLALQKNPSSSE